MSVSATRPRDRVLFVCTANACRSPVAAVALQRSTFGRPDAPEVLSAGVRPVGVGADATTISAAATLGYDLRRHTPRPLQAELVAGAALVVGLSRQHVREAVVIHPAALVRSFPLTDLVRRARAIGPRAPGEDVSAWLSRIGAGRRVDDLLRPHPEDDIPDPVGQPLAVHQRVVRRIIELTRALAELGWPDSGPTGGGVERPQGDLTVRQVPPR